MSRLIFNKFLSADYEGIKQGRLKFYNWTQLWKLGGKIAPTWKDIILHGVTALTLVNSKQNGLNYLKLFGGTEQLPETYIDSVTLEGKCEQSGTPTPTVPVDVVCNNGAIKYGYTSKNLNVGELANQGYTSTGGTSTSTTFCGTLWKIKVSEGEKYTVSYGNFPNGISGVFVNTWKTDGTWNLRQAISISSAYTYTIPAGIGEVNFTLYKTGGITIDSDSWIQVEKGETATDYVPAGYGLHTDGTTETVTDSNQLTATAEMLLSVGDYKDTQEVLTGAVTRNIGIKVFDGTEGWAIFGSPDTNTYTLNIPDAKGQSDWSTRGAYVTHFGYWVSDTTPSTLVTSPNTMWFNSSKDLRTKVSTDIATTVAQLKQFLASQYANGTPVIVVYPTSSSTTETVSGQQLNKEPVTVTGSLTGLVANVVSSSHTTPTPIQPLPINTNNGVLTFGTGNTYNTADGQGTFVSPIQSLTTRIYKSFGKLKAGKYKVKITGDFEFIFQFKDTLDVNPTNYGNIGTWTTEGEYEITDTSLYYGVAIRNAGGSGNIYPSNFNNIGSIGYAYLDVVPVGTVETVEITGKNLLNPANIEENIATYYTDFPTNGRVGYHLSLKAGTYTFSVGSEEFATYLRYKYNSEAWTEYITIRNNGRTQTYQSDVDIAIYSGSSGNNIGNMLGRNIQVEKGNTATTYEQYFNGGSLECPMLLSVGS